MADSAETDTIEALIKNNFSLLSKRLQVGKLIPYFIEKGLLDFPDDKQVIMSKTTTRGKAEALLELLSEKGTCTAGVFVDILKMGDHGHVAEQLKWGSVGKNKTTEGEERRTQRRHLGQSSDSGPSTKRSKQEGTSVLLVNDEYFASKMGIPTINRQLAQLLQKNGATVYCTALHGTKDDIERANKEDGINLLLPVKSSNPTSKPSMEWLTFYHSIHYSNIPQDLTYIVGHADVTSKAAKSIKEDRCQDTKLVLYNHDMPEETEYYKGTKEALAAGKKVGEILEDARNADAVFSVGRRIHDYFDTKYKSLRETKPKEHLMFLPRPSSLFEQIDVKPGGGEKVVLSVGRVTGVEKLTGMDVAGKAMERVAEKFPNVRWLVRGIDEDDWEKSKNTLQENLQSGRIKPTMLPSVLMTSRFEPFGLVGLEAIAAGIPVLISDRSGLADMIKDLIEDKKCHADMRNRIVPTSVNESDVDETARRWAERIADTLNYSESEFEKAAEFKTKLLDSKYWEESHENVLRVCGLK